jgi:hypothetical protein
MKKATSKTTKRQGKSTETKKEKAKSEEFPGYPLYPASEDIMNQGKRLDVDVNAAIEGSIPPEVEPVPEIPKLGTSEKDSDLTKDDFQALASDEIESTGDDEILANRSWPVDFTGSELDVPGSEDDDAQEQIGSEDEENNSYSLGSDRHSDLDEARES